MTTEDDAMTQVTLQAPISSWKRVDDALEITMRAMTDGTFTGIDGATIRYTGDVLMAGWPTLLRKPHKRFHSNKDGKVTGFHTAARPVLADPTEKHQTEVHSKAIIFDEQYIEEIENEKFKSVSIEAVVQASKAEDGIYDAHAIEFAGSAGVENPAVDNADILSKQRIGLENQKNMTTENEGEKKEFFEPKEPQTQEAKTEQPETTPEAKEPAPAGSGGTSKQEIINMSIPVTVGTPVVTQNQSISNSGGDTTTLTVTEKPETAESAIPEEKTELQDMLSTEPEKDEDAEKLSIAAQKLKAEIAELEKQKKSIAEELEKDSKHRQESLEAQMQAKYPRFKAGVLLQGIEDNLARERVLGFVLEMASLTGEQPKSEDEPSSELSQSIAPAMGKNGETQTRQVMDKESQQFLGMGLKSIEHGGLLANRTTDFVRGQLDNFFQQGGDNQ